MKGIVSLDRKTIVKNVNLLRPLLGLYKKKILYIYNNIFNFYIDDPSNKDIKFKRIKITKFINELEQNGLDKKKFELTLKNLKNSNELIDYYVR